MVSLKLLADCWGKCRPVDFSRERFFHVAETIYNHYPGYQAINWANREGVIRWVYPPEPANLKAKNKSICRHAEPGARQTFEKARTSGKCQISPAVKLLQGQQGFGICCPLILEDTTQGYLNGVFFLSKIIKYLLPENILDEFVVRLYENNRLIYHNGNVNRGSSLRVLRKITFLGKTWYLEIDPAVSLSATTAPSENLFLLSFSIVFSAIISILSYFLLQRMILYREARNLARGEVAERKAAERQLEYLVFELAAKNEEMESFIYTVSHDLKAPVVTIEGFIEALKEDYGKVIGEEGHIYISRITDGTRKMEGLIGDILEFSRIGRMTGKKKKVSLADLVDNAVREFQPKIEEKGIHIKIEDNMPPLFGERKRLSQLVNNLISNAIKYMGKDNPNPLIEVGVVKTENRPIYFVRDNGIGISPRYFDRIFQIFRRLSEAKEIEGTGVGLAIAKRIAQNHGGDVWVESEKGKGSTFFFAVKEEGEWS